MKLSELENQFENRRAIMYNANGDKAIYHNRNVRHVSGNIYCGEIVKEGYNHYCDVYVFYDGMPIGLWISTVMSDYDVEEVIDLVRRNNLDTLENYHKAILSRIMDNSYFKAIEIEFSKHIDPSLENQMLESRKNNLIRREMIAQERKEKRDAEEQAFIQQQNDEAKRLIEQAIAVFKSGNGKLENYDITFYETRYHGKTYSIINYLARKYGVKIPIKTQGWINGNLVNITLENWSCENCQYRSKKGGKCSTKIFECMTELAHNIKEAE